MNMDPSKVEAAMDLGMDDGSPGGGSRRPGNLWTVEAREDMFRRREAGETWETICQDYPKRSRHAMQQQYSMMKKQRALANGTWTSNRRGRKRKQLSPERWVSANGIHGMDRADDDLTADEMDDLDLSYVEETNGRGPTRLPSLNEALEVNGRPSPLSRSITDPPPRITRGKYGGSGYSPGALPDASAKTSPPMKGPALADHELDATAYQGKRRKFSPERPSDGKGAMLAPSPPQQTAAEFVAPAVVFDQAEFVAFFQRGVDQAQVAAKSFEVEKAALRASFEASIARANRRAHEANERFRWCQYENGEKVKAREREVNEKLKARGRDSADEKEALCKAFEREKKHIEDIQVKNIEALTRQNEALQRELEHHRRHMEEQSLAYESEIAHLKASMQQIKSPSRHQEMSYQSPPASADLTGEARQHSESRNVDSKPVGSPTEPIARNAPIAQAFLGLMSGVDSLSSLIRRLNTEIETSSMKRILMDIGHLEKEADLLLDRKRDAMRAIDMFQEIDRFPQEAKQDAKVDGLKMPVRETNGD